MAKLPLEIIVLIAEQLGKTDCTSLASGCKAYYRILSPESRQNVHIEFAGSEHQRKAVAVRHSLSGGNFLWASIHSSGSGLWRPQESIHHHSPSRARFPTDTGAKDAIEVASGTIASISTSGNLRTLSIGGYLRCSPADINSIFPRQRSEGEPQISLRELRFHMDWDFFDMLLVRRIQLRSLVKLDIPIKVPEHLPELESALGSMSNLETLLLRDIPAREDFYEHLHCIGSGVRSLPRLTRLGLALTNQLRPRAWEHDERFEKPDDESFAFDMIFSPEAYRVPTKEDAVAQLRQQAEDLRGGMHCPVSRWRPPLKLSDLSLKHIDLPVHALETVFQPEALKNVDISYGRLHRDVTAQLIAAKTKLVRVTGVDYELLSRQLLGFLAVQDELEMLKFMPPTDNYVAERVPEMDDGTYQHWRMTRVTEEIRANTFWSSEHDTRDENGVMMYQGLQNPSEQFLQAMQSKPRLRSLTLPADMFDITPGFMAILGRQLTSLEELEWAFDYTSKAHFDSFARMTHSLAHLKKVTFLSLSRPRDLRQFRAEDLHTRWIRRKCHSDVLNPTLKHVRYRHYCRDAYVGEWQSTSVYYRRDVPVKRYSPQSGRPYTEYWVELKVDEEEMGPEEMFEDGRTPRIVKDAPKKRRARRRKHTGSGGSLPPLSILPS
ncbi:MAG: hypothetical protein Q9217_002226 [Psora testacea]